MSGSKLRLRKWYKCATCDAAFAPRDNGLHKDHCSTDVSTFIWTYPYIMNDTLHSFIKEYESQGENRNFYDDVVQISQSALQICKFVISEHVVVEAANGNSIIKVIWPIPDRIITSVFLTKQAISELGLIESPYHVKVKHLENPAIPAKEVLLMFQGDMSIYENDLDAMLATISSQFCGKLIKRKQDISFQFFGTYPVLNVLNIIPFKNDDTVDELVSDMSNLHISAQYYKIYSSTRWKIIKYEFEEKMPLSNIGGLKKVIERVHDIMKTVHPYKDSRKSNGILFHGVSGTGKTMLCQALAKSSDCTVHEILSWEIFSKFYGEAEMRLKGIFDRAMRESPSIIIIDELDTFCCSKNELKTDRRIMTALLSFIDKLPKYNVTLFATTRNLDSVDAAFRRPGRFDEEIEIAVPSAEDRIDILSKILKEYKHSLTEDDINYFGKLSHGFVGSDLSLVCRQASTKSVIEGPSEGIIKYSHVKYAFSAVNPSAMRQVLIEIPDVRWNDIGGQDELKMKLKQVLEWPIKHPESFERLGIKPPRGILLFGPPGCSKTMVAKAVATETGLNFISIKGAELFSKWVGESEKAVREVFRLARCVSPSVIFFDEIDSISGERSTDSNIGSNVQERVLSQLLTEMDGIQPLSNVTIIAATNRPDRIDSALLRPGRLDRKLYVPLPTEETRLAILQLQFKKTPTHQNVDIYELVKLTNGYSGAEIISVCNEAAMNAMQKDLSACVVKESNFQHALTIVKPRTPSSLIQIYNKFMKS